MPHDRPGRRLRSPLVLACVCGLVHAAFSLYWALGGDWLLGTIGTPVVEAFDGHRWLLLPVAALKAAVAVLPLLALTTGRWRLRLVRAGTGAAGLVLIAWGGFGTIAANLVLAGALTPSGGYDRMSQIGHAWLWDPLFLAWGLALAGALVAPKTVDFEPLMSKSAAKGYRGAGDGG